MLEAGATPLRDRGSCVECGGTLAACLERLGSLRCHDCREEVYAKLAFEPAAGDGEPRRFRAFLHARTAALARFAGSR